MRLLYLFLLPILFSCGKSNQQSQPSHIIKTIAYYPSDSSEIQQIAFLDTVTKLGHTVYYNGFGDTDRIEFIRGNQLDSVQYYTYRCNHWPDTIQNLNDIPNIKHDTKHGQFLTYTEVFSPVVRKIIYDTVHYREDSIFYAGKEKYYKSGAAIP